MFEKEIIVLFGILIFYIIGVINGNVKLQKMTTFLTLCVFGFIIIKSLAFDGLLEINNIMSSMSLFVLIIMLWLFLKGEAIVPKLK